MTYDLIVIGAGAGGLTAAYTAKGFGKTVLLIEKNKAGGECTWSGCVPSKALINIAKDFHGVKKYGFQPNIDKSMPMKKVNNVIESVYEEESPERLKADGIDFITGFAKFVNKNSVEVNNTKYTGKNIIISTGSSPFVPNIEGLDNVDYLTNETLFEIDTLPESIIIIGGGAIGTEMAQALNRLGVKVDLVQRSSAILNRSEPEHALQVEKQLILEGVNIHTNSTPTHIKSTGGEIAVTINNKETTKDLVANKLLIAIGRKPNLSGLNLEEIGIKTHPKGVVVNQYLETTAKGVYAIGDVAGPFQFSHMANKQGITAVKNIFLPFKSKMNYNHVSWCTFTDPELAHSGLTEKEAIEKYGSNHKVYRHSYKNLDRAKTKEHSLGDVKILVDNRGRILGASILGDRAGELISEIQVIKTFGINLGRLQNVIHPYPTYSEILVAISKKVAIDRILNNPIIKLIRKNS